MPLRLNQPRKPDQKMKTLLKRSLLSLAIAGLGLCPLVPPRVDIETHNIDPVHTLVGFTVRHFFTNVPNFPSTLSASTRANITRRAMFWSGRATCSHP
jgi:hypothetical protein